MKTIAKVAIGLIGVVALTTAALYKIGKKQLDRNMDSLDEVMEKTRREDQQALDQFMENQRREMETQAQIFQDNLINQMHHTIH